MYKSVAHLHAMALRLCEGAPSPHGRVGRDAQEAVGAALPTDRMQATSIVAPQLRRRRGSCAGACATVAHERWPDAAPPSAPAGAGSPSPASRRHRRAGVHPVTPPAGCRSPHLAQQGGDCGLQRSFGELRDGLESLEQPVAFVVVLGRRGDRQHRVPPRQRWRAGAIRVDQFLDNVVRFLTRHHLHNMG